MFKDLLQHIHTSEQYLNCDLKNAYIRIRFLVTPMYSVCLASAFNFQNVFWQVSSMRLLNINLQSKFMSNNVSHEELFMSKSLILRYYTTFKMKKFEPLSYIINTCFQKTTICFGLQTEQIFSVNL